MQGRPELYGHTTHDLLRWIENVTESCREISKANVIRTTHQFVPSSKINQFLGDINKTRKLLATLGLESTVDARTVATKCPLTFCILVERGRGDLIGHFVDYRTLWDDHLPYSQLPGDFPRIAEDPDFFQKFRQSQWKFCPAELDIRKRVKLDNESILPILQKRWLAGGVTADLHHVEIHPDYDSLKGNDPNSTKPREFALKTYRSKNPYAEHYYLTEVENFSRLMVDPREPAPGLIEFYGGFEHNGTYNILLEFADCKTLEDFFQDADPPACGADILAFWKSFREVLKALVKIHEIKMNEDDGKGRKVFQGWHQDVKPKNILVLGVNAESPYERHFKLADLGLSHFTRLYPGDDAEAVAPDTMGTRTYGAPELHRRTDFDETVEIKASRAIDIWSLGCVIIEVCVWIIRGKEYLKAFRTSRQQANDQFQPSADDCFHNGQVHAALLDTVQEQFTQLNFERKVSDFVTIEILYHVHRMVRISPDDRPNARTILADIESCISNAESRLSQHNANRGPYCQATLVLRPSISAPQESFSAPHPITPPQDYNKSWQKSKASVSFVDPNAQPFYERDNQIYSSPQTTGVFSDIQHSPTFYNAFQVPREPAASAPPHGNPYAPPNSTPRPFSGHQPVSTKIFDDSEDPERWAKRRPQQTEFGLPIRSSTVGTVAPIETRREHHTRDESLRQIVTEPDDRVDTSQPGPSAGQNPASTPQPVSNIVQPVPIGNQVEAVPGDVVLTAASANAKRQSKQRRKKKHTPTLSVARAIAWKADQKKIFGSKTTLDEGHFRSWLKNRDHIFLIDNALSMQPYWQHVVTLIDPLVYLVKQGDPDGVEVFFTNSKDEKKSTNSTHITNFVNSQRQSGKTDISIRLGSILNRSQKKLHDQHKRSGATPESIYVLTDGIWAGGDNAKPLIKDMVAVLKKYGYGRQQIGIQFISFGEDPDGLDRLEDLDDFGKSPEVGQDIVDTESSTGNVWKMLLGAIDKTFDEAQSEDEA